MYERILVPLDGSPLAEQILPYVRLIGKGLKSRVELLRVIDPVRLEATNPELTVEQRGLYLDEIAASLRGLAQDYLNPLANSLKRAGFQALYTVHEGDAASSILREAERDPDTLIAMSTHGRSGVTRWVLGSITDKVLRATSNPLLVIRSQEGSTPPEQVQLDTVITPLDGSTLAEQALPHVVGLSRALSLKVVLVRVTPSATEYYRFMEFPYAEHPIARYEDISQQVDAEAAAYLDRIARRLGGMGVAAVDQQLLHGNPATAVIDLAQRIPNTLIAITTHGRSGVGRWVLGSVTDRVVRYSGDPVLVIRARPEA